MKENLSKRIYSRTKRGLSIIRQSGLRSFMSRSVKFAYYRAFPDRKKVRYRDILFVNGCTLPHPTRYRVDHQAEQLLSNGFSTDVVFYENLSLEMLKYYRGFIFFRCPVTETVREFIATAKEHNKKCFFDIDDLVIDQKYTDQIKFVREMSDDDKRVYDDGVNRMRETLSLCDSAITTTERLATELKNYTGEVFINRNVASDEMVYHSLKAMDETEKDNSTVVLGYFSGSITHNEDFELIKPSIVKLMHKYPTLHLKIAGYLDVPAELMQFKDRLITVGFMDWRLMSKEMAACDIMLAPLVSTKFNEAKSENKWTEASLVKVVTAASNVGAFKEMVVNGSTGVLVNDDDWFESLDQLVSDKPMRDRIGLAAFKKVTADITTVYTGNRLAEYIRGQLARNIAFVLPSSDISGGVNVAVKHAEILKKHGWDVTLIDSVDRATLRKSLRQYKYRLDIPGQNLILFNKTRFEAHFDTMVATLWTTLRPIKRYLNVKNRLYLVQNFETDFYVWGSGELKFAANSTYCDITGVEYVTISLWCKKWLKERFSRESRYAPNGIDLSFYAFRERSFEGKIKLLIEGDSRSEYKNTDEAFRIVEKLDPNKYEVSYLSYRKEPKDWYRVDHFYNRIAPEKVGEIYAKCDILIKTSLLESFSYPPLEMMATGGVSVVVPNDGNVEYLRDGENCLFYSADNIDEGVAKVEQLVADKKLRDKLIANGIRTAERLQWHHIEQDILGLYQ